MSALFIFGLGYTARAICVHFRDCGWQLTGTVRTSENADALATQGIVPLLFEDKAGIKKAFEQASHCLVGIPPGPSGDPAIEAYGPALAKAERLRWIGYLSTIGVYGNHDGAWVDEGTPTNPATERAAARIAAEAAWTAICAGRGVALDIFRLSGIYGPGRSPIERVRAGAAWRIIKPGQVFNRIHVHDIVRAVVTAMLQKHEGGARIFNITDDEPAPPQDVISYAAELIGAPVPPEVPFEAASLSAMARSFYEDNKRVHNEKMKRELGIELLYPTYREGLRALL